MGMDRVSLRKHMIKEKIFLKQLTNKDEARDLIKKCGISRLNLLIRILYEICQGKVPLSKESFRLLNKGDKLSVLRHYLGCRKAANKCILSTKASKLQFLLRFSKSFPHLFLRLFNSKK